jgi:hypothetical protein
MCLPEKFSQVIGKFFILTTPVLGQSSGYVVGYFNLAKNMRGIKIVTDKTCEDRVKREIVLTGHPKGRGAFQ